MQYRKDKNGNDLSVLGYGCMRFSRKGGGVDIDKAEREIMTAYEAGVNYYDTAYVYVGSEAALGEILERNGIRDHIKIATKLPQYLVTSPTAIDRYFDEQLSRLRTDHVDYYLMHHITDIAMWEKLKSMGILEWIERKKQSGAIRQIGFSYHGNSDGFIQVLSDYDWDISQIQYNYYDKHSQAGVTGLKAAAAKGVPVVIMEPLRGGKLVSMLPDAAKKVMSESERGWSPAEWSFRWLFDQPEVTVVLSGMNSAEMVRENCRTASQALPGTLTPADKATLARVTAAIRAREKVGCTGCRYCMPCPKGVDIPGTFAAYNTMAVESKLQGRIQYAQAVAFTLEPGFANRCIGCGKCEQHCPQEIPIRDMLKKADRALRRFPYNVAMRVGRHVMMRKAK